MFAFVWLGSACVCLLFVFLIVCWLACLLVCLFVCVCMLAHSLARFFWFGIGLGWVEFGWVVLGFVRLMFAYLLACFFGACCLDVRTSTFCQLLVFRINPQTVIPS